MSDKVYEVAVIGGGSAGVMATMRSVLNNDETILFPGTGKDKKKSRAFWVSKVENMPGHLDYKKGIENPNKESLDWLLTTPFKEKLHWLKNRGVVSIQKVENDLFKITDSKNEIYFAKYVILCTGVMDVQPIINGSIDPILPFANVQLADYCLRCDGHHVINKKTTIIGHGNGAAWVAVMLHERYQMPETTILTNGHEPEFSDEVKTHLDKYKIKTKKSPIIEVKGNHKELVLEGYTLEDGESIDTAITFISLGMIVYNKLAISLGANVDERGFVITSSKGETSIENLYAAGDLRAGIKKQIYTAWDSAVDCADDINAKIRRIKRS